MAQLEVFNPVAEIRGDLKFNDDCSSPSLLAGAMEKMNAMNFDPDCTHEPNIFQQIEPGS